MTEDENLRTDLAATAGYTTMMVQSRFTAAALFLAAQGFLVAALVAESKWKGHPVLIPTLGLIASVAVWIMEARTEAQLAALVKRGTNIEKRLLPLGSVDFFTFFSSPQDTGIRLPFFRKRRLTNSYQVQRYFLSHTFALELLCSGFLIFWINAIWVAL